MVKTIVKMLVGIAATLALILSVVLYENKRVTNTFLSFGEVLQTLYEKTEEGTVTYEDGTATEAFWENKKNTLHIWLPHSAILEIDYQLYEAVGCLYVQDYKSALPKIEILLGMCKNIPQSYGFRWENIL